MYLIFIDFPFLIKKIEIVLENAFRQFCNYSRSTKFCLILVNMYSAFTSHSGGNQDYLNSSYVRIMKHDNI